MVKTTLSVFVALVVAVGTLAQDDLDEIIKQVFPPPTGSENQNNRNNATANALIGQVFTSAPASVTPQSNIGGGGGECTCVPYYLCDPKTNRILTDGSIDGFGVIDIRFGPEKKCEHYLETCCQTGENSGGGITPVPTPVPTKPPAPVSEPPEEIPSCGRRNTNGIGFQIAGANDNEAEFGEFPWMVAILNNEPATGEGISVCGGSLIHPQVVLTGAHCVYNRTISSLRIRAGEWDTQTTNEALPFQERGVRQMVVHPQFNERTLYNDVALLVLDGVPLDLRPDNVGVVCLVPQGYVAIQKNCFASGWGKNLFGIEGQYQVILKKIQLPMVSRHDCQRALRGTRLGEKFNLHDSFVCAGGEPGKDTCRGDGGGPLVCPEGSEPQYSQTGIVAWGIGCGENGVPGVYADVGRFRNWIDDQMSRRGFSSEFYKLQSERAGII